MCATFTTNILYIYLLTKQNLICANILQSLCGDTFGEVLGSLWEVARQYYTVLHSFLFEYFGQLIKHFEYSRGAA